MWLIGTWKHQYLPADTEDRTHKGRNLTTRPYRLDEERTVLSSSPTLFFLLLPLLVVARKMLAWSVSSRICLCFQAEKSMNGVLDRLGAPGARVSLVVGDDCVIVVFVLEVVIVVNVNLSLSLLSSVVERAADGGGGLGLWTLTDAVGVCWKGDDVAMMLTALIVGGAAGEGLVMFVSSHTSSEPSRLRFFCFISSSFCSLW